MKTAWNKGLGLQWSETGKIRGKLLSRRQFAPNGCWEYARPQQRVYPALRVGGTHVSAAQAALWAWKGQRTSGRTLVVLHSCDNPKCFNPDHLSLGTQQENVHDAQRKGRRRVQMIRTHDVHGHQLTEANTYWSRGKQFCRICRAAAQQRRNEKRTRLKEMNEAQAA